MSREGKKRKAREKKRKARAAKRPKQPKSVPVPKSNAADQAMERAEPEPTVLGECPPGGLVEREKLAGVPPIQVRSEGKDAADWLCKRRRIWLDFRNGMLVAALLLGLKLVLANNWVVDRFRLMTYDVMQLRLASTVSAKDLPVVIVDISDIGLVDTDLPGRQATPRVPLRQLLTTIAAQNPSGIGIDIDFSPDDRGLFFRNDPEFFRYCLALHGSGKGRIPVFLGVHRSEMLQPERWLDSEEFQELAASIAVPPDSRKMVEAISIGNSARPLPAMAAALAKAYRGYRPISELPGWMFRRVSEGSSSPGIFQAPEFSVDFGPLEALEDQTVPVYDTNTKPIIVFSPRHPLFGKMVLLGNATREKALDQFNVPAQDEPKPGVYLHACAAYTLVIKPLFELTFVGGLLLDSLLAATAFLIIAFIRLYYYKRTPLKVATRPLEIVLLIMLAVLTLVVGIGIVHRTRVIWEDSVLVAMALLFHPSVAELISWARRVFRSAWKAGVFEANSKESSP